MKEKDIETLQHTTWRCQYHIVFAPKYRRMAIYGQIKQDIGQILRRLCEQKRCGNHRSTGLSGSHPYVAEYPSEV